MARKGKSITLELIDEDANGRILCTLTGWAGLLYILPRARLLDCRGDSELEKCSVYLLFNTQNNYVYVGQAGADGICMFEKLRDHELDPRLADWTEAVICTARQDSFGPAGMGRLAMSLYCVLEKHKTYSASGDSTICLGEQENSLEAEMEEYLDGLKTMLQALGYSIF